MIDKNDPKVLGTRVRRVDNELGGHGTTHGTVTDFGCDQTPECRHGEECITVTWDGQPHSLFENARELEEVDG